RRLLRIELRERDLAVGVDERLLIDAADAFQRAHVEGVLRATVSGTLAREFAAHFFLMLDALQRGNLGLGQDKAVACGERLERREPLLHRLEIVAAPHTPHAARRNANALFGELVGHAHLTPGRLLDGEGHDPLLHIRSRAIAQIWFSPADFLEAFFAAGLIQLFEAIEAVAAIAHDLAGLTDISELLRQLQQAHLRPNDLLLSRHCSSLTTVRSCLNKST